MHDCCVAVLVFTPPLPRWGDVQDIAPPPAPSSAIVDDEDIPITAEDQPRKRTDAHRAGRGCVGRWSCSVDGLL